MVISCTELSLDMDVFGAQREAILNLLRWFSVSKIWCSFPLSGEVEAPLSLILEMILARR